MGGESVLIVRLAERLRQIADALPEGGAASLPKSALEEWLSSEAIIDDELDLEQFAAVIRTSVSTAREYCAHGLVPGAYKRRGRKWIIPRASVPRFRQRQQQMHGTLKRTGSHVLGRGRRPDTSAWRRVSSS